MGRISYVNRQRIINDIVVKTDTLTKGTTTDANGVVRDSEGNPVELKTLVRNRDYTSAYSDMTVYSPVGQLAIP